MQLKHKGLVIQLRSAQEQEACLQCTDCDTNTGCPNTSYSIVGCVAHLTTPYIKRMEERLGELERIFSTQHGQKVGLEYEEEQLKTAIEALEARQKEVQDRLTKLNSGKKE